MALLVPDIGERELRDKMLKDALTVDEDLTLKLYKTDVTPAEGDTAASYTVADFTGYVNKTLTRAGWAAAATNAGTTDSSYAQQTWTNTGAAQTSFGYYVIAVTSTLLLWAEKVAASRTLNTSDTLNLTPKMELA